MNARGAQILIVDPAGRIFEEYVDPRDISMGLPGMAQAVQAMKETLPVVTRRTPRERLEAMIRRVMPDMLEMYRVTGKAEWPSSVREVLHYLAERDNDPSLEVAGGVADVIHQGKALMGWIAETGGRQQAAQDYKKVTLDWAGH
jgi:hypothetical protein